MAINKTLLTSQLLTIASSYVGTKETSPNKGPMIEKFQKAVDGVARGEPYCVGFIQFCIDEVCTLSHVRNPLPKTEHSLTLWDKTPKHLKSQTPSRGAIAVWQLYREGKPTMQGHVGLVNNFTPTTFFSIEANTSSGTGISREGDGVYMRMRSRKSTDSFKLLGFIQIWA